MLQGDKSNFRAMIVALQGVTGVQVSVSEKERGEVPAGIQVQTTKEPESEHPTTSAVSTSANGTQTASATVAPNAASPNTATNQAQSSVAVTANPDSAEIYLDGSFVGNAPATLKLTPGKHTIRVVQNGYKEWSREINCQAGFELHLAASLEKTQ